MSSVAAEADRWSGGARRSSATPSSRSPRTWSRSGPLRARRFAEADLAPLRSGVLILTGIGASWHALAPAVLALRRAGRRAFAVAPPSLGTAAPADLGDAFVVVSQSGASAETVAALEQLRGALRGRDQRRRRQPACRGGRRLAAARAAARHPSGHALLHGDAATLGLLCDALLPTGSGSDWGSLPELVLETLRESDAEAEAVAARLREIRTLDAVGGGASVASASETALLMREGVQIPGAGFETRQYLHGPLESAGPGVGCVLFGSGREVTLASSLLSYGAQVVLVSDHPSAASACPSAFVIPAVGELAAPILEILPIQLTAAYLAAARGVSIGTLRRTQADTKVA